MMTPIRILHFADLHVGMERHGRIDPATGLNSRVMDYLRRLSDLVDYALSNDVELVIFAGDAYKNRDPNSTYRREFSWRIKQLADRGIPVVLLPGNHDLPAVASRASSIEVFDTMDVANVHVLAHNALTTLKTKRGVPIQIASVPYPLLSELTSSETYRSASLETLDKLITKKLETIIKSLAEQRHAQPDIPAVLVGHFSVTTAEVGSERGIMVGRDVVAPLAVLTDKAWDYVALGHVHKHQDLNRGAQPPVVYSGSIERIDFGEEKEAKGWVLAQLTRGNTTYEFVPHHKREARRFVTINCDCRSKEDPTNAVIKAIQQRDVKEAIVRVRLRLRTDQDAQLKERTIRAALKEVFSIAGIIKDIDRGVRSRLGEVNVEEMQPIELLDRYFQVSDVPKEQSKQLLEEAKTIMRLVDESH